MDRKEKNRSESFSVRERKVVFFLSPHKRLTNVRISSEWRCEVHREPLCWDDSLELLWGHVLGE